MNLSVLSLLVILLTIIKAIIIATCLWLFNLMYRAGDIEKNPGPIVNSTSSCSSCSTHTDTLLSGNHFLTFTCLNTQSFLAKRDIIQAEFSDRDILLFTETWFNQHTDDSDIKLESFNKPYRTDRNHKVGGGVAIYVKENIFSEEKPEFKINGLECVWVKIHVKGINILFGKFYRPPDSDNQIWEKINYSIDLAINSNADKIIICGDFNDDQLNHSKQKLREICNQNSLYQIITDATYFCERSVSLLDLNMVNDPDIILYSEVGENILENSVRYHCHISAVMNIEKQLTKSFKRKIWQYHLGDYDLFKNELLKINWDILIDNQNINTAAVNITEKILEAAEKSIPNKLVQVRKHDPPWMNSNIRQMIRKPEMDCFQQEISEDNIISSQVLEKLEDDIELRNVN
ncbi:unnamed protein product [Mytilus coruscus]|uniref:Endonuclease/exonuclease/phosphatase domain-containing protein n=1 Tax=Mytilus coruscus TaxID=42192 RepID=A0A6J8F4F3_MYTCO|nr:unnamed protein product [Mytilus coruscus]